MKVENLAIVYRHVDELIPYARNARTHSEAQVAQIAASIKEFGFVNPVLLDGERGIIAGHGRVLGARKLGLTDIPTIELAHMTAAQKRAYVLVDNQLAMNAGWDVEMLSLEVKDLQLAEFDLNLLGFAPVDLSDLLNDGTAEPEPEAATASGTGSLAAQFMISPFSVLNAREGWWQDRKRAWINLGIQSELGRGDNALGVSEQMEPYRKGEGTYTKGGIDSGAGRGNNNLQQNHPSTTATIDFYAQKRKLEKQHGPLTKQQAEDLMRAAGTLQDDRAESKARMDSAAGRGEFLTYGNSPAVTESGLNYYRNKNKKDVAVETGMFKKAAVIDNGTPTTVSAGLAFGEMPNYDGSARSTSGTSIFDPVMCELAYRWFSPVGGLVLDPFAGGSVRGIVAAKLGRRYYGIDLRAEQVEANREQAPAVCETLPEWFCGDSTDAASYAGMTEGADMIFSCPPYADLEVYSDNPKDLSTMDYPVFRNAYREVIKTACARLKNDRFACFVVGEVRDKSGNYYNFVGDTVEAFRAAGLEFYNEAILVTMVGSLPIRAAKQFSSGRKLGKTHQNVLVFVKGDAKKATTECGSVVIDSALFEGLDVEGEDAGNATAVPEGRQPVKVSAAMARLEFAGCSPDYIKDVCHASCCQSSTSPTGTMITIHPREVPAIEARGGVVVNGLLQPKPGEKKCTFKTADDLCGIHFTDDKPFGCIASPFTLNTNGTLIVRNRYKTLKCYKDGDKIPAYKAFSASLKLIFGEDEAARITAHLDAGGGDLVATMPTQNFETLKTNDAIKKG